LEASTKAASDLVGAFDDAAWVAPGPQGATTLGFGLEALWFDTFLHADDMRCVLGIPSQHGAGIRPSLSHIAQVLTDQGWASATLVLDGVEQFPVSGGGRSITGDAFAFVLASTGRGDPGTFGLGEDVNIYR